MRACPKTGTTRSRPRTPRGKPRGQKPWTPGFATRRHRFLSSPPPLHSVCRAPLSSGNTRESFSRCLLGRVVDRSTSLRRRCSVSPEAVLLCTRLSVAPTRSWAGSASAHCGAASRMTAPRADASISFRKLEHLSLLGPASPTWEVDWSACGLVDGHLQACANGHPTQLLQQSRGELRSFDTQVV